MDSRSKRLLITAFLTIASLVFSPEVHASKRLQQQSVRTADTERALSANESLLLRFRQEREELVQTRSKSKEQHLFKNRLTILNSKIDFLEKELSRTGQKVAVVPAARPTLRPLSVRWKRYRGMEPRRGYMLAWSGRLPKMRPMDHAQSRLDAMEAAKNASVRLLAPQPSAKRLSALKAAVPVRAVQVKEIPLAQMPVRSEPALAPLPKPSLPEKDTAVAAPQEAPRNRNARTGADWKKMSRADKEIYILSVMGNLSRRDVYLMKPYSFYLEQVDKAVENNLSMEQEYVHRIVILNAYESEPDTRKDLDRVWR